MVLLTVLMACTGSHQPSCSQAPVSQGPLASGMATAKMMRDLRSQSHMTGPPLQHTMSRAASSGDSSSTGQVVTSPLTGECQHCCIILHCCYFMHEISLLAATSAAVAWTVLALCNKMLPLNFACIDAKSDVVSAEVTAAARTASPEIHGNCSTSCCSSQIQGTVFNDPAPEARVPAAAASSCDATRNVVADMAARHHASGAADPHSPTCTTDSMPSDVRHSMPDGASMLEGEQSFGG